MRASMFAAFMVAGCHPTLSTPDGAAILCRSDDACYEGTTCVGAPGHCVRVDGPCLKSDRSLVPNGTKCGTGDVCVDGVCQEPSCGDGVVERGEECDPKGDTSCRDTCVLAVCGDGVLDRGEGCDNHNADCVACTQICRNDTANCNLTVDDGCECAERILRSWDDTRPTNAAISGGFVYVRNRSADADTPDELARVPLDGAGTYERLATANAITFAQDGQDAWAALVNGNTVIGPIAPDGSVEPRVIVPDGTGIAIVGDRLLVASTGDDIAAFDKASGRALGRFSNEACGADFCLLAPCGEGVLGYDDDANVETQVLYHFDAQGHATVLTTGALGNFGCPDGSTPMWSDGRAMYEALDGESRIAAVFPFGSAALGDFGPLVSVGGAPLVSLSEGFATFTARIVAPEAGVAAVARGHIIGASDTTLVLFDDLGARLCVSSEEVCPGGQLCPASGICGGAFRALIAVEVAP